MLSLSAHHLSAHQPVLPEGAYPVGVLGSIRSVSLTSWSSVKYWRSTAPPVFDAPPTSQESPGQGARSVVSRFLCSDKAGGNCRLDCWSPVKHGRRLLAVKLLSCQALTQAAGYTAGHLTSMDAALLLLCFVPYSPTHPPTPPTSHLAPLVKEL
eukprot:scaffold162996_cov18-Tisochrysis_lutea.AAC.1